MVPGQEVGWLGSALVEKIVMPVGPEEVIEKVAQAGIRGMVSAVGRETISPHVMIDAALHVLAAWVASSQAHSPIGKRDEEVDERLAVRDEHDKSGRSMIGALANVHSPRSKGVVSVTLPLKRPLVPGWVQRRRWGYPRLSRFVLHGIETASFV